MRASAKAQPNIALVKYWGKRKLEENLPAVGSLSITLDTLWTNMSVDFASAGDSDVLIVNGEPSKTWLPRVTACLDHVVGHERSPAKVVSTCNFPMAAGLASSASAFAALVVAASAASGIVADTLTLARAAGRASGSAARSLYGGYVELTTSADCIDLTPLATAADWPLAVVVAITAAAPKPVSSGEAMIRSAQTSPFYDRWLTEQNADLVTARAAVLARDFARLAEIAEHNCLKMHSLTWTSRPAITYWNAATLACMEVVRDLRRGGTPVFFTVDAGPQVKAVCLPEAAAAVSEALLKVAGVERIMTSGLGDGASLAA